MQYNLCVDKNKWNDFVLNSLQGNIFCHTHFLDSLLINYKLVVQEENNNIVLAAIILINNEVVKLPYPFTLYHGLICNKTINELSEHKKSPWLLNYVPLFLNFLESNYQRISFCFSYNFTDLRSLQWYNYNIPTENTFQIDLRYTGIIDLKNINNIEEYLTTVRSVRRQDYKKALKEGYYVERSKDIKILSDLHLKTFQRQEIVRNKNEETLLLSICKSALEFGYGDLLVCFNSDKIAVSASLFLYDQKCGYYLFGANDPAYRKSGSGTLLIIENIKTCFERGCEIVDMVGINSPNRGDFKSSFNAKPIPYFLANYEKKQ